MYNVIQRKDGNIILVAGRYDIQPLESIANFLRDRFATGPAPTVLIYTDGDVGPWLVIDNEPDVGWNAGRTHAVGQFKGEELEEIVMTYARML